MRINNRDDLYKIRVRGNNGLCYWVSILEDRSDKETTDRVMGCVSGKEFSDEII